MKRKLSVFTALTSVLVCSLLMTACGTGASAGTAGTDQGNSTDAFASDFGTDFEIQVPCYRLVGMGMSSTLYLSKYDNFVLAEDGRVLSYDYSLTSDISNRTSHIEDTYDDKGNLIMETNTDENGDINLTMIYQYDEAGHEISENTEADSYSSSVSMTYEGDLKVSEEHIYESNYSDSEHTVTTYQYDDRGYLISYEITDLTDNSVISYTVETDALGRKISVISDDDTITYTYDGNGMESSTAYSASTITKINDVVGYYTIKASEVDNLNPASDWKAFKEASIPTPDSCFGTVEEVNQEENDSAVIYTYSLPEGNYQTLYYIYQGLLNLLPGFETQVGSDGAFYIGQNGNLVAMMMMGADPEYGAFVSVSFSANDAQISMDSVETPAQAAQNLTENIAQQVTHECYICGERATEQVGSHWYCSDDADLVRDHSDPDTW